MSIYREVKDNTTEKLLNKLEGKEDMVEVAYWRKFWELQDFIGDILGEVIENCAEYELGKENIVEIINWLNNNRDNEDIEKWHREDIDENIETLNKIINETDFDKYKLIYRGWLVMENIKREIIEVLDDDLAELKQEIADKKQEIEEKEEELEENEDFEMNDDELDDHIDSCYDRVEIMGNEYPMSEVIRCVNEGQYEDLRDDFTRSQIDDRREELEDELDDLKEELEELEENYEKEFEDE